MQCANYGKQCVLPVISTCSDHCTVSRECVYITFYGTTPNVMQFSTSPTPATNPANLQPLGPAESLELTHLKDIHS